MSLSDRVVVIGHRGAAGLAPENTLAGFRRAYECGVSAVELDVHLVEGELVVIHDETLERTTNGMGTICGRTLESLRALNAGAGERVPVLEEVIAELPQGMGLNVELKGPGTAGPLAELLKEHPGLDVLVSSFDHRMLRIFRQHDPGTRVAPLFHRWWGRPWKTAHDLNAWAINLSRRAATPGRLATAAARSLRTFVYTVNDLQEARALIALGVTGIFTDYPDRITPAALSDRSPGGAGSLHR